ncbi:MAG: hypothetical protein J5685_06495 [Clostridiales bacterium]|nr:hypothetical protein [Clostridiales bacterium]
MINIARQRLDYLKSVEVILTRALDSAPEGKLKLKTINNSVYYYLRSGRHDYYIDRSDIYIYATKRYHTYALRSVEHEIKALQAYLKHMPEIPYENVLASMPDSIKPHITPAVLTNEQYAQQWQAQPYIPKGFSNKDTTAFYTRKGERVRSKSELIIADMLNDLGIPYRYEMPLILSGGKHLIHPDFTILNISTREESYLEHLGKMGDEGYMDDFANRYRIYMSNGIYLGQKLFFTCESDKAPLDNKLVREFLIKTFK